MNGGVSQFIVCKSQPLDPQIYRVQRRESWQLLCGLAWHSCRWMRQSPCWQCLPPYPCSVPLVDDEWHPSRPPSTGCSFYCNASQSDFKQSSLQTSKTTSKPNSFCTVRFCNSLWRSSRSKNEDTFGHPGDLPREPPLRTFLLSETPVEPLTRQLLNLQPNFYSTWNLHFGLLVLNLQLEPQLATSTSNLRLKLALGIARTSAPKLWNLQSELLLWTFTWTCT